MSKKLWKAWLREHRPSPEDLMDELFRKIMLKEITVCETCDTIFDYKPQKKYCDNCRKVRYEEKKERRKVHYEENKEKVLAENKVYYEKNKEKIHLRQKEYRKENKEKINSRNRAWYKKNKMRRN